MQQRQMQRAICKDWKWPSSIVTNMHSVFYFLTSFLTCNFSPWQPCPSHFISLHPWNQHSLHVFLHFNLHDSLWPVTAQGCLYSYKSEPDLSLQSLCWSQRPILWLGLAVEEMHHPGGECQNEPVGTEYHQMPGELLSCELVFLLPGFAWASNLKSGRENILPSYRIDPISAETQKLTGILT